MPLVLTTESSERNANSGAGCDSFPQSGFIFKSAMNMVNLSFIDVDGDG